MVSDKQIRKILSEKKLSKEISRELNISDREWRKIVNEYNQQYENRERLIVSDNKGYELTTNKKLIRGYAIRQIRNAVSQIKNAKKILRCLAEKNQLKLDEKEDIDLVDAVMKMKV